MTAATHVPHVPHALYDILLLIVVLALFWVLVELLRGGFRPEIPVQLIAPL